MPPLVVDYGIEPIIYNFISGAGLDEELESTMLPFPFHLPPQSTQKSDTLKELR
jgi:hypothetical protein